MHYINLRFTYLLTCQGIALQNSPRLHHFKSDRDEFWQDCF